jgi:hypothetical protein
MNYPNPLTFNEIKFSTGRNTIIKFINSWVEVATLLNEVKQPGLYEINFNATKFSSGAYFYSIQTDNFREVKKMILLK